MVAPAVIGAGINLLGGILGGRSAKKAAAQQRAWALEDQAQQFVRLRDAAEAGGFNPLTALNANPGGGMVNPTPALASGQFVADALSRGVETYFNVSAQQRDQERDKLEKALMRQELKNMQAQGKAVTQAAMGFGYAIPTANNYTGVDTPNPSLTERPVPERQVHDLYVDVYDSMTGRWVSIPNPDLMDSGPVEMASGLAVIGAADAAQNGVPALARSSWWDFGKPAADAPKGAKPKPMAGYQPSYKAGYDALTGSSYPSARINQ